MEYCILHPYGIITPCKSMAKYFPLVLINNEMHNSYNQFLFHSFLSAVHVSKESSRSLSGARHNTLYYTVQFSTIVQANLESTVDNTSLDMNTLQFSKWLLFLTGLTSPLCKNVVKCCVVIYSHVCGNIFLIFVYCIQGVSRL